MRRKNSVIAAWSSQLKKRYEEIGAQEEFGLLMESGLNGNERYVEWVLKRQSRCKGLTEFPTSQSSSKLNHFDIKKIHQLYEMAFKLLFWMDDYLLAKLNIVIVGFSKSLHFKSPFLNPLFLLLVSHEGESDLLVSRLLHAYQYFLTVLLWPIQ